MKDSIPSMSVEKVVDALSEVYTAAIKHSRPISTVPSVMLWGPPGVGKSQAVQQIAKKIEESAGKPVEVTDVRLMLFNPIDLRGIPTSNADKTLAVWLRPKIFDMDPSPDRLNLLFLDEITAAPQSVQAAAYQITLDRVFGEHRLPENCIVIAAGNRVTDKSVAYKMPRALANRMIHIDVKSSFSSWKKWAIRSGIHEKVVGFLSFRNEHLLCFDPAKDDLAFPTPRTWEMVSGLLHTMSRDVSKLYPLIAGLVGTGTAIEFRTWDKIYQTLPKIEDIFDGKNPPLPKQTDALYALISAMTSYARKHRNALDRIENSIRYAEHMPPDFSTILIKDYMVLEQDYISRLMTIPAFPKWMRTRGSLLNGTV